MDDPVIVMWDEITAKEGLQQQLKNLVDDIVQKGNKPWSEPEIGMLPGQEVSREISLAMRSVV